jgi:tetratricopeptide (TPR) repeat protein
LDEAALLARQLPNLGRLLRDEGQRGLVRRTLEVVQGHPELIKLAERQAATAEALLAHLDRALDASTVGQARLAAFFAEGESRLDAPEFLGVLGAWTRSIADSLTPEARAFFHFLCCVEEGDREGHIVGLVWPNYWKRLGREGEPPSVESCTGQVHDVGLVDTVEKSYRIHPGVAEAGREQAGEPCRTVADEEMAEFWRTVYFAGRREETHGGGPMILRAGRSGVPYLMRRQEWDRASTLLEGVALRDRLPGTLAAVLPLMRRIADATKGSDKGLGDAGVLAKARANLGQAGEAERMMRQILHEAEQRGQFLTASATAGDLVNLLRGTGRPKEALAIVDKMKELTRRAGLGPWTQLADEGRRLQLQNELGRYSEVLEAVERLRKQMRGMPLSGEAEEGANPWNVREVILDTGRDAARGLERWEEALAFNQENVEATEARGATDLEIARTRFNDYVLLLRLGRYSDARQLLLECRQRFEEGSYTAGLGAVLGALADLEDKLGRHSESIRYGQTALRYNYHASEPANCAISHFNLANCLTRGGGDPQAALAHRLASAVIRLQTSEGRLTGTLQALSQHLASFSPDPPPLPGNFDELSEIVERVEGVRFRELFSRLPTENASTGDEALQKVLELASRGG